MPGNPTHTLNIAHRGARAYAPENTLAAFSKAKDLGCDMFELDVRLSKDGVAIVHHDENLLRCTDAITKFPHRRSYQVCDFTYPDLSCLDAGSWYVAQLALPKLERLPFLQSLTDNEVAEFISSFERESYASGNIKIPTLAEALSLAKELGLLVNVELKEQPEGTDGLVETVLAVTRGLKMADQVLISSFDHGMVKQVRNLSKSCATAILTDSPIQAPITYLQKLKANAYNIGCYKDYKNYGFSGKLGQHYLAYLRKVRRGGFGVNVWTCNDPTEMAYLLSAGVSGLISDYPNRVRASIVLSESK